jgi:hypothetical protein
VDSDFLLAILRDMLPKRPDLKVLLMSATMDTDMFKSYFAQPGKKGSGPGGGGGRSGKGGGKGGGKGKGKGKGTGVTRHDEIPVLSVPGRVFPVEDFYLEDAVKLTGYDRYIGHGRLQGNIKKADELEAKEKEAAQAAREAREAEQAAAAAGGGADTPVCWEDLGDGDGDGEEDGDEIMRRGGRVRKNGGGGKSRVSDGTRSSTHGSSKYSTGPDGVEYSKEVMAAVSYMEGYGGEIDYDLLAQTVVSASMDASDR